MRHRAITTTAVAVLAAGLAVLAVGLAEAVDPHRTVMAGAVLTLGALIVVTRGRQHAPAGPTDGQLADARLDGYRLALSHVAAGLLDPPQGGTPATDTRQPHLYAVEKEERKGA
ncbi:hypothetical protein N0X72_25505 [Streptomyces carpaticus]|uniref:hypothetical protein n=1 Tax=Streptomyces carpaticus TaxID=285558 RepID=UPI002204DF39|nr:hypothetical protein N0X72_25505 [Streptomyces carpaticus]